MLRKPAAIVFLSLLVVGTAGAATAADAAEQTRWINVHVTEKDEGTKVQVHLPMSLVLGVVNSIDVDGFRNGMVNLELDDAEVDWPTILRELKKAPDGEFVTVEAADADVKVSKQDGIMHLRVSEHEDDHAEVGVTLPMALIDALKIDENNRVDVRGLLRGLADLPLGDIVQVTSDDADVRIWLE